MELSLYPYLDPVFSFHFENSDKKLNCAEEDANDSNFHSLGNLISLQVFFTTFEHFGDFLIPKLTSYSSKYDDYFGATQILKVQATQTVWVL